MAKTVRKIIALVLAVSAVVLLLVPAADVSATYTKGDYVIDGGTLVSYTGTDSDITIPIGITAIGKDAFSGNNILERIYIPDEVISIDYAAFENCRNLQKVSIGNGVKNIGASAFSGCSNLSEINIPRYTESIGSGTFAACSNLSNIIVDPKNRTYVCLDGVLYTRDGKKLVQYLAGRPYSTYEIPQPVSEIEEFGFYGSNMLTSVDIAYGVEEIPEYAFLNCTALNSVKIPGSVKQIRKGAFGGCPNLKALNVPTTVGYIDPDAFTSLSGVKGDVVNEANGQVLSESGLETGVNDTGREFEMTSNGVSDNQPDSNTEGQNSVNPSENNTTEALTESNDQNSSSEPQSIIQSFIPQNSTDDGEISRTKIVGGQALFLANPKDFPVYGFNLEDAQIEDSISESGNLTGVGYDFRNDSGNKIDVISGNLSHYRDDGDTSVYIPDGVYRVGNRVFYNNRNIQDVTLPQSVSEIGDFSFARSSLSQINIPDGTERIGYAAFYNCSNLNNISVPMTVKEIELGAFDGTGFINKWKNTEDGDDFLILGDGILAAYKGYKTDVTIPSGVKQVGPGVFTGNTRIRNVSFPDSVTKICEDAFNGCSNLKSVDLPKNVHVIEDRAFKDTALTNVTIPFYCEEIGLGAFDTVHTNGGMTAVIFKGTNLPDNSFKPTAERLSADNLRTNAFNGVKYAFIPGNSNPDSGTIFNPNTYGFRGEVYSNGDGIAEGTNLVQLRKCTLEPDINGNVSVDSEITIGDVTYMLSGVSENAFSYYKEPNWCVNKLTGITLDGNTTSQLDKLLEDVNFSAQTGANTGTGNDTDAIKINSLSDGIDALRISALLPHSNKDFNLFVGNDNNLTNQFYTAFDNRFGNHNNLQMSTMTIDMKDRLNFVPIKKMAKSKLEISMPLPLEYYDKADVRVATIDDNGLLEEVPSSISENNNGKEITFVASHLSPFAVYTMYDPNTEAVIMADVTSQTGLPGSVVYGTLTKEIAFGVQLRYIAALIFISAAAVLWFVKRKTLK